MIRLQTDRLYEKCSLCPNLFNNTLAHAWYATSSAKSNTSWDAEETEQKSGGLVGLATTAKNTVAVKMVKIFIRNITTQNSWICEFDPLIILKFQHIFRQHEFFFMSVPHSHSLAFLCCFVSVYVCVREWSMCVCTDKTFGFMNVGTIWNWLGKHGMRSLYFFR